MPEKIFTNNHTTTFKVAYAEIGKLESSIAASKEYESKRFSAFLRLIRLGDRIHWIELDDRVYEGTATSYLNSGTDDFGVAVAIEYGYVNLTVNKAPIIATAWVVD